MSTRPDPHFADYRYSAEVILTALRLYLSFPLNLRMAQEVLAARRITVSYDYETVRQWGLKFGRDIANSRGNRGHLDDVVLTISGKRQYLRRAADRDGFVLDVLVQSRRDTKATKRQLRKLLKKQGAAPQVITTNKLKSYAAKRETMPGVAHRQHKSLNNRAENSPPPTRRRERQMKRFKSAQQAQRFLSIHAPIANLFNRRRLTPPPPSPCLRDLGRSRCVILNAQPYRLRPPMPKPTPKQVDGT